MSKSSAMREEVVELLGDFYGENDFVCKSMFGGVGVFVNNKMFGLFVDDSNPDDLPRPGLYLKGDEELAKRIIGLGGEIFKYPKRDKVVEMKYYRLSEKVYDDREVFKDLIDGAVKSALI